MSLPGRSQERSLNVFGRYLRIACQRKAERLGVLHYSWSQLARDSGVDRGVITDAVSGTIKQLGYDKVWKLIDALEPDADLEKKICSSLHYSTRAEYEEAMRDIDRYESEDDEK